jgi:hypothetical protein
MRLEAFRQRHGLRAAGGFSHDVHILSGAEHGLEAGTDDAMVVGENHAN